MQLTRLSVTTSAALACTALVFAAPFSGWSPPVNLGPVVNSPFAEANPFLAMNGRSLYFTCLDCPGGFGGFDLYVAQRASVGDPWGAPQNLGPVINTAFNETNPEQSTDGRLLFFTTNRPGGFGGTDLYVTRRHDKRDDFGWQEPVNLGGGVNTTFNDRSPAYLDEDECGVVTLFFASERLSPGTNDIFVSRLGPDQEFAPAVLVPELSTPFDDNGPTVRKDGLELFLDSNRPGSILNPTTGLPSLDLWVSTRPSARSPWSVPVNLGSDVNHPFADTSPTLSWDGTTLYFVSAMRSDNVSPFFDLWQTTRAKLRGRETGVAP